MVIVYGAQFTDADFDQYKKPGFEIRQNGRKWDEEMWVSSKKPPVYCMTDEEWAEYREKKLAQYREEEGVHMGPPSWEVHGNTGFSSPREMLFSYLMFRPLKIWFGKDGVWYLGFNTEYHNDIAKNKESITNFLNMLEYKGNVIFGYYTIDD